MDIEDQVCSLELSKKLKKLGVKQNSYFKWWLRESGLLELYHSKPTSCAHKYYSAFTVAELGLYLKTFSETNNGWDLDYYITYNFFNIVLKAHRLLNKPSFYIQDLKEADARAKMLIYLIENKIIKV